MAGDAYLQVASGGFGQKHAVQTSAGSANAGNIVALNASGVFDLSFLPTGIGADTAVVTASENLAAGAFVNIWSNSGAFAARNADGSTTGKEAHGFVLAAVTSGASATVYFNGTNNAVSGLSPGVQYLSATTVGAATATAPSAAGQTLQRLGVAVAATALNFTLEPAIALA